MQRNLKLGLIVASQRVPAWQYVLAESLMESRQVDAALILSDSTTDRTDRKGRRLYSAFRRFESRRNPVSPDAMMPMDLGSLFPAADTLSLAARASDDASQPDAVATREFDAFVALTGPADAVAFAGKSRFGACYYAHAGTDEADGDVVGFRAVIRREPCIYSALMLAPPDGSAPEVISDSHSGVNHLSHGLSRNAHLWKILSLAPRWIEALASGLGTLATRPNVNPGQTMHLQDWRLAAPMVSYFAWRIRRSRSRRRYSERWHLLLHLGGDGAVPADCRVLVPPDDVFWADPFIVRRGGRNYIFFEEASVKTGKGHIALMMIDDDGKCGKSEIVLERPYHLSYPFIFEWDGNLYMIPESAQNRTIEVYRCTGFPDQWVHDRVLMHNVRAYDTTLHYEQDRWWMFTNIAEREGASSWDELWLFAADNPLSDNWEPHQRNPVVSDVRSARPAGAIFRRNGRSYRPSQDSSNRYGYGLKISEVTSLSLEHYSETTVEYFQPDWRPSVLAIHTYNRVGDLTCMDAILRTKKNS